MRPLRPEGPAISTLPVASMRPLVTTPFTIGPSVR
jgi:hypothetical protein